ncbi:translation initiation factor IF-2-like [Hemicordylus capensis]|uniref:translation initiation factor IF-2-like n=1 Tax=Hemicordylus capensis TaxID=884348 RepID=UPI0023043491|nr:translation initiation factor IF-2-like [Hemicordylus capensis]
MAGGGGAPPGGGGGRRGAAPIRPGGGRKGRAGGGRAAASPPGLGPAAAAAGRGGGRGGAAAAPAEREQQREQQQQQQPLRLRLRRLLLLLLPAPTEAGGGAAAAPPPAHRLPSASPPSAARAKGAGSCSPRSSLPGRERGLAPSPPARIARSPGSGSRTLTAAPGGPGGICGARTAVGGEAAIGGVGLAQECLPRLAAASPRWQAGGSFSARPAETIPRYFKKGRKCGAQRAGMRTHHLIRKAPKRQSEQQPGSPAGDVPRKRGGRAAKHNQPEDS